MDPTGDNACVWAATAIAWDSGHAVSRSAGRAGQAGWAVTALAAGLGMCAVARVFEVDPNTVLSCLVEAAEHSKPGSIL
jgi:hypothetical protein